MRHVFFLLAAALAASATPVHLRCDSLDNPIGIDSPAPRLSWQSDNTERNWRQSAYQILVATSAERLLGRPDVWDSGRRASGESIGIAYAGPRLESRRRYYWTVRVWDTQGRVSRPRIPAFWEMGLLGPAEWAGAQWISRPDAESGEDRAGIRWIWVPGQDGTAAPGGTKAVFRIEFNLNAIPRNAGLYLLSRARFDATVNGHAAAWKNGRYQEFDRQEITDFLRTGSNTIEVTVTTAEARSSSGGAPTGGRGAAAGPAGLAGLVKIVNQDGSIERLPTAERWQVRLASDPAWKPATVFAELADERMKPDPGPLPGPAALLRKSFDVGGAVRSARLYVTALGSYRMFLNGTRVGNDLLTPELTDYRKRTVYQTYDVTPLLARGENALGAMLGDGWFASGYSWIGVRYNFLPPPTRLLARLHIEYADRSAADIVTDGTWKTSAAPILHSEIYSGEVYDARLEQSGWDRPGFRDPNWHAAAIALAPPGTLDGQRDVPPRVVEEVNPERITKAPNGGQLVDLGQNMAGWARLRVTGPAGTLVRMRFAEILGPDGNIYTDNLRNANATDVYILRGGGLETFEPHFTYHGFRYIEVTGYPGQLTAENIAAVAVSSAQQITGKLTTSNELVNRIYRTAIWGQRSNFVSIPTDCPQRDERHGWMGDAQLFWRSGTYNADIAALGRKWMRDVVDAQTPEGAFANTSPAIAGGWQGPGTPGWADAGVVVPWTAWLQYGDTAIIAENWDAMERFMAYVEGGNPDYLWRKRVAQNLGDWLPVNAQTPRDLAATAYWAYSASRMAQMAAAIGKPAEARRYTDLFEKVRAAFQKEFVKPDGTIGTGSQTSYSMALYMGLVPPALVEPAVERLVKDIEAHNWHLTTGFLGTPPLLPVLSANGHSDVAYRLLLNETFPSWGYMLSKGATTWWEHWDSDRSDPAMNSFNHFAFGSVAEWIYRAAAGIEATPSAPGFREVVIRPHPDERVTAVRGEFESVYGKIVSDWTGAPKGPFTLNVTIPANTRATVYLPAIPNAHITEGGKPVTAQSGPDGYTVKVGSGTYRFEMK